MPHSKVTAMLGLAGAGLLLAGWTLGRATLERSDVPGESGHVLDARTRALEAENQNLRRELHALRSAEEPASPRAAQRHELLASPARVGTEERDASVGLHAPFAARARVVEPPRLTAEQRRLLTLRFFGELLRELQLDPQRSEALVEVLASHAERAREVAARLGTAPRSPEQAEEMRATYEELREERRRDVVAAIGEDQASRFEALEKTAPARMELKQVRDHLEGAGVPLSDEQRATLLGLMTKGSLVEPPQPREGESMEDAFGRFRQWRSDWTRQVREHASTILTPAQLEQLDAYNATNEALQAAHVPLEP